MTEAAELWTITGRVQGVGYRDWLVREARRLGVAGHVRNRVDGTVEALVGGPDAVLATLRALCRRGPPGAAVASITVAPGTAPPSGRFERRPTG